MVTYQYRAIGRDGKQVRGVIRAQDEMTAVQKIRETCPVITAINPVKEKDGSFLTMEISRKPKMKNADLAILCSQFEIMLQAGMPVARCVAMIADQTENKKIAEILKNVADDVSEGSAVASAFERNGKDVFPTTFTETIRAGEEAGTLEDTFRRMHHYYDKSAKNMEKLQQALSYPIFVLVVAAVVLIIVMAKVKSRRKIGYNLTLPVLRGVGFDFGVSL
jgi:type IV pilus assembly protein PilC